MDRCVQDPVRIEAGLQAGTRLRAFWFECGHWREGQDTLGHLLAVAPPTVAPEIRAAGLYGAATLGWAAGDLPAARSLYEEALAIHQQLGDTKATAESLHGLAKVASDQGRNAEASSRLAAALTLFREVGDSSGVARSFNWLGVVASREGDDERAVGFYQQCLPLLQELGDRPYIASVLRNLGWAAWRQGDVTRAAGLLGDSLALACAEHGGENIGGCAACASRARSV